MKIKDRINELESKIGNDTIWFHFYEDGIMVTRDHFSAHELIKLILEHLELEPRREPGRVTLEKRRKR